MISTTYSIEQSIKMLQIMGVNRITISPFGNWPDHILSKYERDSEFFFTTDAKIMARETNYHQSIWSPLSILDEFWTRKISQSASFQCAKFCKLLQKKTGIKNIGHLICKFNEFDYIPSQILT